MTRQAVWFTKGTPDQVRKEVAATMRRAHAQHAVPVLVAYDLPYRDCSQYSAGGAADPNDFSTWALTDKWYLDNVTNAANPPSGPEVLAHAVIDTSRNGQGPWIPPADHPAGDPQVWCNPPDRGLGLRPTTRTGEEFVDAYLWVKIPGESDGQCTRWADPAAGIDPVRGTTDPVAGEWFPQMALELTRNASPRQ